MQEKEHGKVKSSIWSGQGHLRPSNAFVTSAAYPHVADEPFQYRLRHSGKTIWAVSGFARMTSTPEISLSEADSRPLWLPRQKSCSRLSVAVPRCA